MISCDDCPSSTQCSGRNLHPVLVRVFDLYASGKTDKFDILFALGPADEELLERYTTRVSHACWTKAALLAIAEVVGRLKDAGVPPEEAVERLYGTVRTARDAFARFPWRLDELVEQAPDLYDLIVEQCPDAALCEHMNKRAFSKMCKEIAFA